MSAFPTKIAEAITHDSVKKFWSAPSYGIKRKGLANSYLGKGDIGNNDGVHGAGSSAEGLALVTVGVVLVLVDLAILGLAVPGHGALANANVALRVHGGGLAAEVPILWRIPN